jgi:rhomboid-like protein
MSSSPHLRESSPKWHFLAFFVSGTQFPFSVLQWTYIVYPAGLFSGLVSHIASSTIRYPRLISQISSGVAPGVGTIAAKTATSRPLDILPSLGASGAIYAAVTVTTLAFPETQISLIFPPTYPIPITYGVGGLLALDLIGAFRGWRSVPSFR